VSTAVGNVRNNDPSLVEPIPAEESLVPVEPLSAGDGALF
jgi:hypothetical protein